MCSFNQNVSFSFTSNYTGLSSSSELIEPVSKNKQHATMTTRVVIRCSRMQLFALTSEWLIQDLFWFHYTYMKQMYQELVNYWIPICAKNKRHSTNLLRVYSLHNRAWCVPYHFQEKKNQSKWSRAWCSISLPTGHGVFHFEYKQASLFKSP